MFLKIKLFNKLMFNAHVGRSILWGEFIRKYKGILLFMIAYCVFCFGMLIKKLLSLT